MHYISSNSRHHGDTGSICSVDHNRSHCFRFRRRCHWR